MKLHNPGVGSKPLPLIVPIPVILRKTADWLTTTEELRSKVNPPTVQRPGVAVDGLKVHADMAGCVPRAMPEKSPVSRVTSEVFQLVIRVAVFRDMVSKVTTPLKSMSPRMGRA